MFSCVCICADTSRDSKDVANEMAKLLKGAEEEATRLARQRALNAATSRRFRARQRDGEASGRAAQEACAGAIVVPLMDFPI